MNEKDLIQLNFNKISKYILQQHNLSLEMERDLNLNIESLQKVNFEGTILNIGEKISLISFNDKQRLRVLNKDLLPSFNKIEITEEMLEEIKIDGQKLIKEQEDFEISKSLELPNEALTLYNSSSNKKEILNLIIKTCILDIKCSVSETKQKKGKFEYTKNLWLNIFKDNNEFYLEISKFNLIF